MCAVKGSFVVISFMVVIDHSTENQAILELPRKIWMRAFSLKDDPAFVNG